MYKFLKTVFGGFARRYFKAFQSGIENIPPKGPAIIASNHIAAIDSVIFPLLCPRQVFFMGKDAYFNAPGLKGKLKAKFFRSVGSFPVDRSGGSASEGALIAGMRVLNAGNLMGIYPEGTRSPDGRLYKARSGIARLALESKAPVIPVAMIDTEKAQVIGQVMPKPVRCGALIGKPMTFPEYYGKEITHEILRDISDRIMVEIQKLGGQEYIHEYAPKKSK